MGERKGRGEEGLKGLEGEDVCEGLDIVAWWPTRRMVLDIEKDAQRESIEA